MASESPWIGDGCQMVAAADLRTKQFFAVKITASRTVGLETSGAVGIYGILQNKPNTGEVTDVAILGIVKAIAGAGITAGATLETDTSGRVVTKSSGVVVGIALETVTTANQIVTIKIIPSL